MSALIAYVRRLYRRVTRYFKEEPAGEEMWVVYQPTTYVMTPEEQVSRFGGIISTGVEIAQEVIPP